MMKKILFLVAVCFSFCACAGTPPRWWNPSGNYGAEAPSRPQPSAAVPATSLPSVPRAEEEDPASLEQHFDPAAENYEELALPPYPQVEEMPAPSASVSVPAEQKAERTEVSVPAEKAAITVEEVLPADGSLPPPSVLE